MILYSFSFRPNFIPLDFIDKIFIEIVLTIISIYIPHLVYVDDINHI